MWFGRDGKYLETLQDLQSLLWRRFVASHESFSILRENYNPYGWQTEQQPLNFKQFWIYNITNNIIKFSNENNKEISLELT